MIMKTKVIKMPTVTLKFRFKENQKVKTLMDACSSIQQQAVNFAIDNNKTATFTIIKSLYPSLKTQYPYLHTYWLQSACRSGAAVVHSFKNRKRKGKTNLQKPKIKRPFVYVSKQILKVLWDGNKLILTFPLSPYDKEPIVLTFRPHHKYCRLLDEWKEGRAEMGEPTLTYNSISIPLKFPEVEPYKPKEVIAIDSNESNLTAYKAISGEVREIDTSYAARVSREHDRRVRKGTKSRQNRQRLLNFWSIMTFHKILAQKAALYGVPLIFVPPENTSRKCPICGKIKEGLRGHVFECACGLKMGRHKVGAMNIACRGVKILGGEMLPRQGLVGDPCCLSSGYGLRAQSHDRNTQPTA